MSYDAKFSALPHTTITRHIVVLRQRVTEDFNATGELELVVDGKGDAGILLLFTEYPDIEYIVYGDERGTSRYRRITPTPGMGMPMHTMKDALRKAMEESNHRLWFWTIRVFSIDNRTVPLCEVNHKMAERLE